MKIDRIAGWLLAALLSSGGMAGMAQTDSTQNKDSIPVIFVDLQSAAIIYRFPAGPTTLPGFTGSEVDSATHSLYRSQSLAEVLSETTPVFIKSYGIGSLSTVSFRGTGASHTQLYWNGIPANTPTLGHTDLALVPLDFADGIQIGHGGAALNFGSGSLGGAIQMEARPQFQKGLRGEVSHRVASFEDHRSRIRLAYGNKNWEGVTRVFYNRAQNDFAFTNTSRLNQPEERLEHAALKQYGLQQEAYWKPNNKSQLSIRWMYADSDRELPNPLTANLISQQIQQDQVHRVMAQWESWLKPSIRYFFRSGYTHDQLQYQDLGADIYSRFSTDGLHQTASFSGYNFTYLKWNAEANLDYFRANSTGIGGVEDQVRPSIKANFSWQRSDKYQVSGLIRQEWNNGSALPFQPSLSGSYRLFPKLGLHANVARTARIPSLNDLYWQPGGNPDLRNEKGWQYEVGSNWLIKSLSYFTSSLKMVGYHGTVSDWILWSPLQSGIWTPQNLRTVDHTGIEVSGKLNYKKKTWGLYYLGQYAYTSSVNKEAAFPGDAAEGKQLLYVPEHQASQSLTLRWRGYNLNYRWQYVGLRFSNSANTAEIPAYQLSNLQVERNFRTKGLGNWQVRAELRNAFDVRYQAILNRPMPGRHYAISLMYQFEKA